MRKHLDEQIVNYGQQVVVNLVSFKVQCWGSALGRSLWTNSLHEDPRIQPQLLALCAIALTHTHLRHQHVLRWGPMRCYLCTINNYFTGEEVPCQKIAIESSFIKSL